MNNKLSIIEGNMGVFFDDLLAISYLLSSKIKVMIYHVIDQYKKYGLVVGYAEDAHTQLFVYGNIMFGSSE